MQLLPFVHQPVTVWHPAMMVALILSSAAGWAAARHATRLLVNVSARARLIWFVPAILLVAAATILLPIGVFNAVWYAVEPPQTYPCFVGPAPLVLLIPLVVAIAVVLRVVRRSYGSSVPRQTM